MSTRRDPFTELMVLNETYNRFFDSLMYSGGSSGRPWSNAPIPLDVVETDAGYGVQALLPGMHPDDLSITYANGVLTIEGEIRPEPEAERANYLLRERFTGKVQRSLPLPAQVDADRIEAHFANGVLELFLPKRAEAQTKRITVQSDEQPRRIAGPVAG